MNILFKIIAVILFIIIIVGVLQFYGIAPKRCDDLGPSGGVDSEGNHYSVVPSGKYCYGIWEREFWFPPMYL